MKIRYQSEGISINTVGVKLTPSIWQAVQSKVDGIYRRYPKLLGLRVDLKRDPVGSEQDKYVARTRLILPGYDRIVEKSGEDLYGAISKTMEVANRQLRRLARSRKTSKKGPQLALIS